MMRRIAVSQRVDAIASYGERRDALDQRWSRILLQVEALCLPMPNHAEITQAWLDAVQPDGVILSGGNDLSATGGGPAAAPERDAHESAVLEWARARGCPVLGVCRGLQMMNVHLGGTLKAVDGHVACRHAIQVTKHETWMEARVDVNSYHNWGIDPSGLAAGLEVLATTHDGTVEAVRHVEHPWYGIMWHPEREAQPHPGDLHFLRSLLPLSSP